MTLTTPRALALFVGTMGAVTLGGCAGLKPAPNAAHLHPETLACASKPEAQACLSAFLRAAEARQRRDAGQALLGFAETAKGSEREQLATLALWLEPTPWLAPKTLWSAGELGDLMPNYAGNTARRIAFDQKAAGAAKLGGLPSIEGVPRAQLVAALAAAGGAQVAVDHERLVPAAPLIARLTTLPVQLDGAQEDAATALAKADAALASGDVPTTLHALKRLTEAPVAPGHCQDQAALHHARFVLGPLVIDGDSSRWDDIIKACPAGTVEGDLYAILHTLQGGDADARRSSLRDPKRRAAVTDAFKALRPKLSAAQVALVEGLLVQETSARFASTSACETPAQEKARQDALREEADQILAAFARAGREDLASDWRAYRAFNLGQPPSPQTLDPWLDRASDPRLAWARLDLLREALMKTRGLSADPLDRVQLQPLCEAYSRRLGEAIGQHKHAGEGGQLVTLLLDPTTIATHCPRPVDVGAHAQATLKLLTAPGRTRADLVRFLAAFSGRAVIGVFTGQSGQYMQLLQAMRPGLDAIQHSDSPEDQVAATVIRALSALATGQPPTILYTLDKNLDALDAVLAKQQLTPKSPELLRMAPTLRLVHHAVRLTALAFVSAKDAPAQLARMQRTLVDDVRATLVWFEQDPQAARALASRVEVLGVMLRAAQATDAPTRQAISGALEKAARQAPVKGWGGVITNVLDAAAWSALAYWSHQGKDLSMRDAALQRAEAATVALAERSIADFSLQNTRWELLRMLPSLYRVGADAARDPSASFEARMAASFKRSRARLEKNAKAVLGSVKRSGNVPNVRPEDPDLVVLLVDVLDAMTSIGLSRFYDPAKGGVPDATVEALAGKLEALAPSYPPELRVYIWTSVGALRSERGDAALDAFTKAHDAARSSAQAREVVYLPLIVAMELQRNTSTAPSRTLALLKRAQTMHASGDAGCAKDGAGAALTLARAQTTASTGDNAAALSLYKAYFEAVGGGAPSDIIAACSIEASRGQLKATLKLSGPLASGSVEDDAEGKNSFQVGLGWGSQEQEHQTITCTLSPNTQHGAATQTNARAEAAIIALTAHDMAAAREHMDHLASEIFIFTRANPNVQGPRAQRWVSARDALNLEVIRFAATLAAAHGLWHTAEAVDAAVRPLQLQRASAAKADDKDDKKADDKPKLVRAEWLRARADWTSLGPIVRALYPDTGAPDADAIEAALKAHTHPILSDAARANLLTSLLIRTRKEARAATLVRATISKKIPMTPATRPALASLSAAAMLADMDNASLARLNTVTDALTAAGLSTEAAHLYILLHNHPKIRAGRPALYKKLDQLMPADAIRRYPFTYRDVVAARASVLKQLPPAAQAKLLGEYATLTRDLLSPQNRHMLAVDQIRAAVRADDLPLALKLTESLVEDVATTAPLSSPTLVNLLTRRLVLQAALGKLDRERARQLGAFATAYTKTPTETLQIIKALIAEQPPTQAEARGYFDKLAW